MSSLIVVYRQSSDAFASPHHHSRHTRILSDNPGPPERMDTIPMAHSTIFRDGPTTDST